MGEFKEQKWELSDEVEVEKEWKSIQPGKRTLHIRDCIYDKDEKKYTILFDDVNDEGVGMSIRYWLDTKDKNTGQLVPNNRARATLISLGRALAGKDIGIPKDTSIIGGVVIGEVKYYEGSEYPKVFKYFPATDTEVLMNSDIEQYSVPDTDGANAQ